MIVCLFIQIIEKQTFSEKTICRGGIRHWAVGGDDIIVFILQMRRDFIVVHNRLSHAEEKCNEFIYMPTNATMLQVEGYVLAQRNTETQLAVNQRSIWSSHQLR